MGKVPGKITVGRSVTGAGSVPLSLTERAWLVIALLAFDLTWKHLREEGLSDCTQPDPQL